MYRSQDPDDEQSNIRNSILRQTATSWPSIKARLLTVSEAVLESRKSNSLWIVRSAHVHPAVPAPEVATQRIFLAKSFTLVATMCECNGEFMADRFKNDIWTVASRHLSQHLEERERNVRARPEREDQMTIFRKESDNHKSHCLFAWSDSERLLILAILKCVGRVFRQEECGPALSSIMPLAATMLLPFLDCDDDDEPIFSSAMQALKSIALVDSDVLWRPLAQLSGRGIPPCPLRNLRRSKQKKRTITLRTATAPLIVVSTQPKSAFLVRCNELIDYIDSLAEQPL
jgi:hypothetical protein